MSIIAVFEKDSMDWTGNGLAALIPTSCDITEEAGGEYELTLVHPCDPWGKWRYLVNENIIRAPVPVQNIPAITPQEVAYWRIKTDVTDDVYVYAKPLVYIAPESGSLAPAWNASTIYHTWDKVSVGSRNYILVAQGKYLTEGGYTNMPTGAGTSMWKLEGSETGKWTGGGRLGQLYPGDVFIKLSAYDANWMRVRIENGIEGYVKTKYSEFYEDVTEAFPARKISEQAFRIYNVAVDSEDMSVTANARHISYDFYHVAVGACEVKQATPSTAISILQASTLFVDVRTIASNISAIPVTGDWSWNNAVYALLDEEVGLVHQTRAKLIRDNNDFFLLKNEEVDNGFSITYGNNLIGVNWNIDTESAITRLIPRAQDTNGNLLLLPEISIDSTLIDNYAVPRESTFDTGYKVGERFTDETGTTITLTEEDVYRLMRRDCNKQYNVDRVDIPVFNLDVEFLMLGDTEEYAQYKGLQLLALYDTVQIKHTALSFITKMQMKGYTWDAMNQRYKSAHFDGYYDSIEREEFLTRPVKAMTSNSQDGCLVTASSISESYYAPYGSFDYKTSSGWVPKNKSSDPTPWIQMQMDIALTDITIYMYSRATTQFAHPTAGYVEVSNDGQSWTRIADYSGWEKKTGELIGTIELHNEDAYSYIRITTTAKSSTAEFISIGYIYFTGRAVYS